MKTTRVEFLAMIAEGLSDHDIGLRLGVSETHAKLLRRRKGVRREAGRSRFMWSEEDTAEVVDMMRDGKGPRFIADALGYPYQRVLDKMTNIRGGLAFFAPATKQRRCLHCREEFASEHAGNRICEGCAPAVADAAPMMVGVSL